MLLVFIYYYKIWSTDFASPPYDSGKVHTSLFRQEKVRLTKNWLTFGIPSRHDDPAVFGIILDGFNNLCELIDPLSRVVGILVNVRRTEMSPLETVDGSQVTDRTVCQTWWEKGCKEMLIKGN